MATSKEPSDAVIDKDTTARINVAILCSIIACACCGTWWTSDMTHSMANISQTVKEVKVEVTKIGGSVNNHAMDIIRLQEQFRDHEKRLQTLEGK